MQAQAISRIATLFVSWSVSLSSVAVCQTDLDAICTVGLHLGSPRTQCHYCSPTKQEILEVKPQPKLKPYTLFVIHQGAASISDFASCRITSVIC